MNLRTLKIILIAAITVALLPIEGVINGRSLHETIFNGDGASANADTRATSKKKKKKKGKKKKKKGGASSNFVRFTSGDTPQPFNPVKSATFNDLGGSYRPATATSPFSSLVISGQMNKDQSFIRVFGITLRNVDINALTFPSSFALTDGNLAANYTTSSFNGSTIEALGRWFGEDFNVELGADFTLTLASYSNGVLTGNFEGTLADDATYEPANPPLSITGGEFKVKVEILTD